MAVSIADLFISVSADVSAAQTGLTAISNQLNKTANSFQQAAPAALLLAGAGAAVEAGFVGAVKVAADFEHQMSGVRAVMTPKEVLQFGDALDQLALQLGAETSFSAQQAAAGIEELIKAGVPAQAVLEGAGRAALNLAAATGTDVATSATIAAQAMNAFKIPVSELPTIVDRLAGVVNVSAADMSDLRFGLQSAGAVAATVGLSFTDTAAAIGIFANNGLRGQDAGTSLKTMLINLVPNTKQQTAAFKQLGLITADGSNAFFDAQGHVKGLADISGVLQNALSGMTDQQKLATLQVLFGTDAMRAAAILARTGAAGVNEFVDQIKQVSAADQAAERLNNLLGRLEQLGGSLQTVQILVGRFFLPAIGAIADQVKNMLNAFSGMSPQAQAVVTAFVAIGGAASALIGGIVLLAPVIATVGPSFGALGRVLLSLLPAFRIAAPVAGTLFVAWQSNLFGIRNLVEQAFSRIPAVLDSVASVFARAGTLWESSILPAILTIGNEIERRLIPIFNTIVSNPFFINFALAVQKAFSGNIRGAVETFLATIGALAPGLGKLIVDVRSTISGLFDRIGPILGNLGLVFQKILAGDIGGAFDTFRATVVALFPFLVPVISALQDMGSTVLPLLQSAAAAVATFWDTQFNPAIQRLGTFLATEVGPRITEFASTILPTLQTAAESVRVFWETQFGPSLSAVGLVLIDEVLPKIAQFKDQAVADLVGGATTIKAFWDEQLLPTLSNPAPKLDEFRGAIERFVTSTATLAQTGNLGVGAQALSAFFANFDTIKTQVESLQPLFTSIGNFGDSLRNLATAIDFLVARSLGALIGQEFALLGTALSSFVSVVDPARPALDAIGTTVGTLGTALSGVTTFFNDAATAINNLATAIQNINNVGPLTLPQLPFGIGAPATPGPQVTSAGFNLAGAQTGGGPVLNFNAPISINGAGNLNDFAQAIAAAINASARRVSPPVPAGQPGLVSGAI